jgi:hypothetical protein
VIPENMRDSILPGYLDAETQVSQEFGEAIITLYENELSIIRRREKMITTSEIAVTVTIWVLTGTGGFFGIRAALRKKRSKSEAVKSKLK